MRTLLLGAVLLLPITAPIGAAAFGETENDYPTAARADYVFGCMNVNGGTQDALLRCSCAIDVIASILPYARYEAAETVMRMSHDSGYLGSMFRTGRARDNLRDLREAQAEAEVRCF
ncbi:hypothetical protein [Limobrevibacterium gyesilva]|uniref:Rap1a immunity protein domain-containing protein n=1 Tax=Limobrevibacterium gyesilva TaxID=2991712 RepID=A0AA42CCF1_9PROT|nr:hypothetical protein [Limobrevibacterium gyesilva]MCW3473253.1 hypothetical protein [Limobrevibacterium gyesilva]